MSLRNELRKIASFHTEQANHLERSSSEDALYSEREETTRRADRANAITSHRQRAAALNAEADQI
ncbi:hypothetical protein [Streptomyces violaceorubidus]|uniref:hypothetical protein n=1 Tax=Streptomyces violaceorubidus TaxID=284042 RepID=UPI0004BFC705|nr:hypothetical protein [Streptomyces violaceorubidus]